MGKNGRAQRIRDPLHDLIEFRTSRFDQMLWRVIQTEPFQRLRRIRQLGFSEFVYPGATHTRFAHSLGVFYNARRLMDIVKRHIGEDNFDKHRADIALTAALLHDVGHGPFSHSFEAIGKKLDLRYAKHETVSDEIIRKTEIAEVLNEYIPGMSEQVADLIGAKQPVDIYSTVVSSQFDADRLDYMQRDRMMSGTQHSAIDLTWLIANLEIDDVSFGVAEEKVGDVETFVLSEKAIFAAETYVVGLFQLYPTVYFHKATRSAEKVYFHLFFRIIQVARSGDFDAIGLSRRNPLIRFAEQPDSLENALLLDDAAVWGALTELVEADDKIISQLARMLRERRLPKAIDLRQRVEAELGEEKDAKIFEKAVLLTRSEIDAWSASQNADVLPIWTDSAQRVPYKNFQEDLGPLNQIMIRHNGTLVDLREVSTVVKAIEPFKFDRAYIPFPSPEYDNVISEIVKNKCIEARKEQ